MNRNKLFADAVKNAGIDLEKDFFNYQDRKLQK